MVGLESRLSKAKAAPEASLAGDSHQTPVGGMDPIVTRDPSQRPIRPHIGGIQESTPTTVNQAEVIRKIKQDYAHYRRVPGAKGLDSLHGVLKQIMGGKASVIEIMKTTARTVYSQFNIKEVTIGLKSSDGLFRYVAQCGLRDESWNAHLKLSYEEKEIVAPETCGWKCTELSRQTRLFIAEDNPYTEEEVLTRSEHLQMRSRRKTAEESIEGDYMDVLMLGPDDRAVGWIETGGTWDGKLPDAGTVRTLEVLASILAVAVVHDLQK